MYYVNGYNIYNTKIAQEFIKMQHNGLSLYDLTYCLRKTN